ncbi:hypothetical protein D3C72_1368640 [compost metagenome]
MHGGLQGVGLGLRQLEQDAIQPSVLAKQGLRQAYVGEQQPIHGHWARGEGARQAEGESTLAQQEAAGLALTPVEAFGLGRRQPDAVGSGEGGLRHLGRQGKERGQGAGIEQIQPQQLEAATLLVFEPGVHLWHGVQLALATHQLDVERLIQPAARGQPIVGIPRQLGAGGDEVGLGAVVEQVDGDHQGDPQHQPGQAHQQQPGVPAIEPQQRL